MKTSNRFLTFILAGALIALSSSGVKAADAAPVPAPEQGSFSSMTAQLNGLSASDKVIFLIKALDQMPPEKTLEVLREARANSSNLRDKMTELNRKLLAAKTAFFSSDSKKMLLTVDSDLFFYSEVLTGAIAGVNLIRSMSRSDWVPLTNMTAHPTTIEGRFFWTSVAAVAITDFAPSFINQQITINTTEINTLFTQIDQLQQSIEKENALLDTLVTIYSIDSKVQKKK